MIGSREGGLQKQLRRKLAAPDRDRVWPGVLVCAALTGLAYYLHTLPHAPFTLADGRHPLSAVLLALLLGMVVRNTVPHVALLKPGIDFVVKRLLVVGIVLLGASLDFYHLIDVSLSVLLGAALLIAVVILAARRLGRSFQVRSKLALLLGIGTAICGTSAIVVAAPVLECEEEEVAVSVTTVNLLGALSMLLFPVVATLLTLSPELYGIWCGLAIHATPQVIAAGFAHPVDGQTAGEVATIVKLVRISLLAPAIFIIGALYARHRRRTAVYIGQPIDLLRLFPGFVLFFILAAFLRTTGFLPQVTFHMTDRFLLGAGDRTCDLAQLLSVSAGWLITSAMAGVGLMTAIRSLAAAGGRPFALGLACTGMLTALSLLYASI